MRHAPAYLVLLAVAAGTMSAQTITPATRFEVASVKRATGGASAGDIPRNMDSSPHHFAMRNVPLRFCLEWAYDLKDFEISGPDWIKGEERYDVIAAAPGATEDQMRSMLQVLLVERFQMKLRREKRELPIYALTTGAGDPKLKRSAPESQPGLSGSPTSVAFTHQPLARLTFLLSRRMDRPVLDLTGLTGAYDFTLDTSGLGFNGAPAVDESAPSIFATVRQDLGLKLEARKQIIEMLVIDHAEKVPTEN